MQVVFRFLSQLMIEIPDATIFTLVALLQDPTPFLHHADQLPSTARTFITDHLYNDRQYNETRNHILRRLFHVLSNPTFERMFGSPANKLSMKMALDQGRVVLVNTAKSHLKAEWSSIFGRYCVALIMQATFARSLDPENARRPAFVYLDEAHEYLDRNIDTLLLQARKYAVSLCLSHQTIDQLSSAGLKASVVGMPAIRYTGDLTLSDRALLAPEMRSTPEFLAQANKREGAAVWAVHARNLTPTASLLTVPFLTAERAPKMSDAAYAHLLTRIRSEVSSQATPAPGAAPPPPIRNATADDY